MADANAGAMETETVMRRRKATGPRSKKGCRTCRIRRVKCDEKRPECHRCTSTGRWCEWFQPGVTNDGDAALGHASGSRQLVAYKDRAWNIVLCPSNGSGLDLQQQRSFDYFRQKTAPQLSGVFSSQFWDYVLLQATHHSDTLRYAVIALGALHERFENSDPTILKTNKDAIQGGFALRQYVNAIRSLVSPPVGSPKAGVDIYLVASLLFASFETIRGHHGSAIQHVRSGIRILAEIAEGDLDPRPSAESGRTRPLVPLETLAVTFTRLDTQVRQLQGSTVFPKGIARAWKAPRDSFCEEIPEAFESIGAARNSLDYLWNDIVHVLDDSYEPDGCTKLAQSSSPAAMWARQWLIARCDQWTTAAKNMMNRRRGTFSPQEVRGGQMMEMFSLIGKITLNTSGLADEMAYDQWRDEFAHTVDLAAAIVEDDHDSKRFGVKACTQRPTRATPRFQMDMGIIVVLFQIIWKCRDSAVRRKAIRILEDNPWQEGLWDGLLCAKIGLMIVEAEEGTHRQHLVNGAAPAWSRVHVMDSDFDLEERRCFVTVTQNFAGPQGGPVQTKDIVYL